VVTEALTGQLGRNPETVEVARELGVTASDVERIRDDVRRSTVLHLDAFEPGTGGGDTLAGEPSADPVHQLLGQEMRGYLHDAVQTLPERLRKVVVEYFFEERQMKDIAEDLGVTISRVSQLRSEAIKLLRDGINAQFDDRDDEIAAPAPAKTDKKAAYYAAIASASDFATRLTAAPAPQVARVG
jgi:RNA polymerase sigma factor FliA